MLFAHILLSILGWKKSPTSADPPTTSAVVIAYPHTCNMDGFLIWLISKIQRGFIASKGESYFAGVVVWCVGAIPIIRNKGNISQTDQIVKYLSENEGHLYIAPEGTRKRGTKIHSGFYHIAQKAGYPIVCGNLDYRTKEYSWRDPIDIADLSYEETVVKIAAYYRESGLENGGKHPEKTTPFAVKIE